MFLVFLVSFISSHFGDFFSNFERITIGAQIFQIFVFSFNFSVRNYKYTGLVIAFARMMAVITTPVFIFIFCYHISVTGEDYSQGLFSHYEKKNFWSYWPIYNLRHTLEYSSISMKWDKLWTNYRLSIRMSANCSRRSSVKFIDTVT